MNNSRFQRAAERLFAAVLDHPVRVIVLFALLALAPFSQLPRLRIVTDLRSLIPQDEVQATDRAIAERFGIKEFMIVAIEHESGVFDAPILAYAQALASGFSEIPGVFAVRSLFSEDDIRMTPEGLRIEPFVSSLSVADIARARTGLAEFPAVRGILASADETCMGLLVELEEGADKQSAHDRLSAAVAGQPAPDGVRVHLSGLPVFEGVLGGLIIRDLLVLLPIVTLVVALVIFAGCRSWALVLLALAEIVVVNVWAMGLMAFLGRPIYILHACMPVFLVAIVLADEIHIFATYAEKSALGLSTRDAVFQAMAEVWRPVVLTSLTTGAAFLSFLTSSMIAIRSFGVFIAFGIGVAMVFSLLVTPAVIVLAHPRTKTSPCNPLSPALAWLSRSAHTRRRVHICFVLLLTAVAAVGASRVYIQDDWIANFRKGGTVCAAAAAINAKLHGTRIVQVELDTGRTDGIHDPDFLRRLAAFQRDLEQVDGIGGTWSVADPIIKLNREMAGDDAIPDNASLVAQYLFLLEGTSHDNLWDFDKRWARILLISPAGDFRTGTGILSGIQDRRRIRLPDAGLRLGGDYALGHHWVGLVGRDQPLSLLTSMGLVFLLVSLFFRSFRKGLRVTAPTAMGVLLTFGVMGWFDIPLSVTVSMVSSIVLGISVDYAIHFQSRYDVLASGNVSAASAAEQTFRTVGGAVVWDALVVVIGLLALYFSAMPPNRQIGYMAALGVASSMAATLLVMPLFWNTGASAAAARRETARREPRPPKKGTTGTIIGRANLLVSRMWVRERLDRRRGRLGGSLALPLVHGSVLRMVREGEPPGEP
jgi:uncharacterized protein